MPDEINRGGIFFERIDKNGNAVNYPAWRYHDFFEPKIVNNTEEDRIALDQGWKNPRVPITAIQGFQNFVHDLEDMNCRQLVRYALDEFDAELPENAGKAKLLHAIWRLARVSKKNEGRMVLLAQTIEMDLDAVQKEILEQAGDLESCSEITKEEVWV